ncbi:MAG: sigma factor G inhibitor Gin [Syntrophomonadaceae bacterium]|jgi:hypothetical protein
MDNEELKQIDNVVPRCSFCHQVPEKGIRGGWKLRKIFVCQECEKKIINSEIGSPYYREVMGNLARIFNEFFYSDSFLG